MVKRRDPLAEREAKDTVTAQEEAAGRTGGGTERAIVYDDAALDKLLDRSDLERSGQGERVSCLVGNLAWDAAVVTGASAKLKEMQSSASARPRCWTPVYRAARSGRSDTAPRFAAWCTFSLAIWCRLVQVLNAAGPQATRMTCRSPTS